MLVPEFHRVKSVMGLFDVPCLPEPSIAWIEDVQNSHDQLCHKQKIAEHADGSDALQLLLLSQTHAQYRPG